jgi:hypothetical protein
LVLVAGLAAGLAACGQDLTVGEVVLVVENRIDAQVALTNDLRVEPCSRGTFTEAQVLEAHRNQRVLGIIGQADPSTGVVPLGLPTDVATQIARDGPMTAIVTPDGTRFVPGPVGQAALPACEGASPSS